MAMCRDVGGMWTPRPCRLLSGPRARHRRRAAPPRASVDGLARRAAGARALREMPAEIASSANSLGDGRSSAVIAIHGRRHQRSWAPPIRLYRSTATARVRSPPSGCCQRRCGSNRTSRRFGRGEPRSGEIGRDDTHGSIEIRQNSPRSQLHFAEIGAGLRRSASAKTGSTTSARGFSSPAGATWRRDGTVTASTR